MTSLIFHYTPFSVTTHIYTCRRIHKSQSINPGLEHNHSSLDRIYKIPRAENHVQTHAQNHGRVHPPENKDQEKFSRALPQTPTGGANELWGVY